MGSGKVKQSYRIISLLVATSLIFSIFSAGAAAAVETAWTQTSRTDFEPGTLAQLDASRSPGDVKLGMAGVSYLYAFRGNNQKIFWRYNTASNNWTPMADAPDKVRWGGGLAYDGGNYIYAFRGNGSGDFWRYSLSANSWTVMAGAPGTVKEGGALTYHNGYLYALRGDNTRDFWRYNPAADSWTARASTDSNVLHGGTLTGDGGNYIYAFQGGYSNVFRRYDIAADAWTVMADAPAGVGAGAALSYDGSRYIYALRGGCQSDFWKYDILTDMWSVITGTTDIVEWGGSLAFAGSNHVYALSGGYSQRFWRYNTSTDIWEWRTGTTGTVYDGGALVSGAVTYFSSGNLTSVTRDTGYNADFGTISWTANAPSGTAVKFQIAANNDNATWVFRGPDGTPGTYYTSGGAAVWSGHDGSRYVKYQAFFSTTNTGITPVLNDVAITYSRQIILPTVTAGEATPIEETMAVLYGTAANDGGEACQYRFQYGQSTGNYTRETGWAGSVTSGGSFSADITGLSKGTRYYFRAQLKNSAGTGNSTELSILTRPAPPVAGSFSAKAISGTQVNLSWVKGEGARRTVVRRKTGDYPAAINDGALVYFDTGTSVSDTGLTPETSYYYRAWSEVTGSQQWSSSSQAASATTLFGGPVAVGGTVYQVNKALVLAPWLGLVMLILAGGGAAFKRLKRIKA